MVVEDIRIRLRRKLEDTFGVDEAALLMDRPPGGWGEVVTNQTLDLKLSALEARWDAKFSGLEAKFEGLEHRLASRMDQGFRDQTWRLVTATLASTSVLATAMVLAVRL